MRKNYSLVKLDTSYVFWLRFCTHSGPRSKCQMVGPLAHINLNKDDNKLINFSFLTKFLNSL